MSVLQEGYVVQYRVKGRSQKKWGEWTTTAVAPPSAERAVAYVERQRAGDAGFKRADIEWRALKVTTEVLT